VTVKDGQGFAAAMKAAPPSSIEELISRYAKGERNFARAELNETRALLSGVCLDGADFSGSFLCVSFKGRLPPVACIVLLTRHGTAEQHRYSLSSNSERSQSVRAPTWRIRTGKTDRLTHTERNRPNHGIVGRFFVNNKDVFDWPHT
jgi:hypothetical protein